MGAKLDSIQALRGLAVLLVLLTHMTQMESRYGSPDSLLPTLFMRGTGGVDLFFVVSGFVMVVVSAGRFRRPGEMRDFLYRRATRIYPLYWIYSALILAVFLLQPHWVNSSQASQVDFLASFFLLPQDLLPLLGQAWTLAYEVYFYLVFALALLLPERWLPRFLLVWGLLVTLGWNLTAAGIPAFGGTLIGHIANPLTLEFILGALAALYPLRLSGRGTWIGPALGLAVLAACIASCRYLDGPDLRLVTRGLPMAVILWFAVAWERRGQLRLPRSLLAIGDASYSIYLSHILVLSAVGRLWQPIRQPGLWDNALAVGLMGALSLVLGFASYRWLECPLMRFFRSRSPLRTRRPPVPLVSPQSAG